MFQNDLESRSFRIAVGLLVLAVGSFLAYARWVAHSPVSVSPAAGMSTMSQAQHDSKSASPPVIATVYECNGAQGRVLSDRRCADDAKVRQVMAPNRMPAGVVAGTTQTAQRSSSRAGSARVSSAVCASIEEEIDSINARMRQKYLNSEGERFRQRLRELSAQRWEAKCRLHP